MSPMTEVERRLPSSRGDPVRIRWSSRRLLTAGASASTKAAICQLSPGTATRGDGPRHEDSFAAVAADPTSTLS